MRFKVKQALKEVIIMNTNKKILLIITFLLIMCTGISISYAFFKVASSNNNANTNVTINGAALCMSLQLSSNNVTLSNEYAVPVSDAKALSSDVYKTEVTIQNNCGDNQSFNLLLVPNSSNTMPIKALKYALTEEGVSPTSGTLITNEYILDSTIQKQLLSIKNETLKSGFSIGSGTVNANTSKTFNLYLWIDKDEGSLGNGSTMDKILNAYLTLGSGSVIGDLKLDLYHTIENRYNQDKTYLGLYTGEGADTYANPVYYYKGNVQNNNVLFGGFCWKIVRTTETGGVKIVYNGVQKNGSCNNTGTDSQIGESGFNEDANSLAYVGYMYNTVYKYSNKTIINSTSFSGTKAYGDGAKYASNKYTLTNATTLSVSSSNISTLVGKYTCNNSSTTGTCSILWYIVGYSGTTIYYYSLFGGTTDGTTLANKDYVFGSSFTYADGLYSLSDTVTLNSDTFITNKSNINTHHYTCLSSGTTCSSIYYVYYIGDGTPYYITLTGGKSVNDALNEMLYADDVNKDDSTIKKYIDSWYENNLIDYEDKLEKNVVFCNDRSISNLNGWNTKDGSTSDYLYFKNYSSVTSLVCANETDRFSHSNTKAYLKYPIGLLSVPELRLASYGISHYFNNGQYVWLDSPAYFSFGSIVGGVFTSSLVFTGTSRTSGVRPSVSLKPGTEYVSGDGSFTSPFVIE